MKKTIVVSMMVMFLALGAMRLWAHDDDKTPEHTLTGEVVCLSCYLGHGGMGSAHAKCAKQCFVKGLPLGLKVGDKLYLVVGEHHGTANKALSAYAGKQVTVTGHVFEQDGMSMLEVEKVVKTPSSTPHSKSSTAAKAVHKTYVCTMDGTTSHEPGKCPKCGMDMVEKK